MQVKKAHRGRGREVKGRVSKTPEQKAIAGLSPSINVTSPQEKANYELATFRAGRKHRQSANQRGAGNTASAPAS